LYDSTSAGYSTRKDILLRVRGVMIHTIGRLSLVSNVPVSQTALVIDAASSNGKEQARRRLQTALQANNIETANLDQVRQDAMTAYESIWTESPAWSVVSTDWPNEAGRSQQVTTKNNNTLNATLPSNRHLLSREPNEFGGVTTNTNATNTTTTALVPPRWSDSVIPYPFTRDDKTESIRQTRTPAARRMPPREQVLEANAANCRFEISMDVQEVEWTVGDWRNLMTRRFKEMDKLDPNWQPLEPAALDSKEDKIHVRQQRMVGSNSASARAKAMQDQALAMTMIGKIHSDNCNFTARLNVTAIRTDWDATTSKAINYSFYMMIVCLTQILILLRQLLHSQSQSVATRVSLLCIGWQTVIDALSCLVHIYLSLAMQPLFTAFASVAFFKLLIFCIIEMKVRNTSARC
jgi:hypothetical protein